MKAPTPLIAELMVVEPLPLLMTKSKLFPVNVFNELAPIVMLPEDVVIFFTLDPPKSILPLMLIKPEPVVMSPAFQVKGPLIVKEAFVPVTNAKL
ncbi:hypothetical protein POBR111598_09940 [Polynucleobacter brandtiae]